MIFDFVYPNSEVDMYHLMAESLSKIIPCIAALLTPTDLGQKFDPNKKLPFYRPSWRNVYVINYVVHFIVLKITDSQTTLTIQQPKTRRAWCVNAGGSDKCSQFLKPGLRRATFMMLELIFSAENLIRRPQIRSPTTSLPSFISKKGYRLNFIPFTVFNDTRIRPRP